jgi:hypothetical protein
VVINLQDGLQSIHVPVPSSQHCIELIFTTNRTLRK